MNSLISKRMWKSLLSFTVAFAMLGVALVVNGVEIPSPTSTRTLEQLIVSLTNAILMIAIPLATAAIVFVGFKLVLGSVAGDTKKIGEAKTTLWWVLIGTAVVVGSSALARAAVEFARTL